MDTPEWLVQKADEILQKRHSISFRSRIRSYLSQRYLEEQMRPPKIAIIGKAGVGKSSTINSLFNTHLRVGRINTGTYYPRRIRISKDGKLVQGGNGDIIVYDMPGLGESIEKDEKYIETYLEILSNCDVAVWVISAIDRSLALDQYFIQDVVNNANRQLLSRLVIGVNKVDLVSPNNWNRRINLPSRTQERNYQRVYNRVLRSMLKACPSLDESRVVLYSASRRYNLITLFNVMLDACPKDRAWLLGERGCIADYWELVYPEYRELVFQH